MMNKRKIDIVVLFFSCLLFSCTVGVYYDDLGNNYAWEDHRTIIKITEKGDKYINYNFIIRPEVLNYDYDERYIIVYQVYSSSTQIFYGYSWRGDEDSTLYRTIAEDGEIVKLPQYDSLVVEYNKIKEIKNCYWIIDKETDEVMGPMRKEEFDRRCKTLNVKAKMHKFFEDKSWDERFAQDNP